MPRCFVTGFWRTSRHHRPTPAAVTEEILAKDEEIVTYPLAINPDRVRIVPVEEMFREVSEDRALTLPEPPIVGQGSSPAGEVFVQ